jgi:hypothetical protein
MCKRPETTFVANSVNTTYLAIVKMGFRFVGSTPPAQGNLKYVVVVVEYFSKWIEAKPLATITSVTV